MECRYSRNMSMEINFNEDINIFNNVACAKNKNIELDIPN